MGLRKYGRLEALALSVAVTAFIAGCGGGGGGGSAPSNGSQTGTTPPVVPDAGNLLTTWPTFTYAAGSREAEIFAEINTARGLSYGYARQSAALDKAAAAHALYLQTNIVIPVIGPEGTQYEFEGIKMFEFGPIAVTVECTAKADGRVLGCTVLGETHPGLGFGEAAVALMNGSEVAPGPEDIQFARTIQFMP